MSDDNEQGRKADASLRPPAEVALKDAMGGLASARGQGASLASLSEKAIGAVASEDGPASTSPVASVPPLGVGTAGGSDLARKNRGDLETLVSALSESQDPNVQHTRAKLSEHLKGRGPEELNNKSLLEILKELAALYPNDPALQAGLQQMIQQLESVEAKAEKAPEATAGQGVDTGIVTFAARGVGKLFQMTGRGLSAGTHSAMNLFRSRAENWPFGEDRSFDAALLAVKANVTALKSIEAGPDDYAKSVSFEKLMASVKLATLGIGDADRVNMMARRAIDKKLADEDISEYLKARTAKLLAALDGVDGLASVKSDPAKSELLSTTRDDIASLAARLLERVRKLIDQFTAKPDSKRSRAAAPA